MSLNKYISNKKYNLTNNNKKILAYDLSNSFFDTSDFPIIIDSSSSSTVRLLNSSIHITGNINFKDNLNFNNNVNLTSINFISDSSNSISTLNGNFNSNNNIKLKSNLYIETALTSSEITGSITECAPGEDLVIGGTGCNIRKKIVNGKNQYVFSEGASRGGRLHNSLIIKKDSIEPNQFNSNHSKIGLTNSITKVELGNTEETAKILQYGKRITLYFDFENTKERKFLLDLGSNFLYDYIQPGTTLSIRTTNSQDSEPSEIYLKCSDNAFFNPVYGTVYKMLDQSEWKFNFNLMPHDVQKDGILLEDVIVLGKYTSLDGAIHPLFANATTFDDITDFWNDQKSLELIYCGEFTNSGLQYKMWIFA